MVEMVHSRITADETTVVSSCCTAMWEANGKTTILILLLGSLFPEVWKRLWTCRKTDYYLTYFTYTSG
jgi:hypothetical protein